jgi:hypothetical protein
MQPKAFQAGVGGSPSRTDKLIARLEKMGVYDLARNLGLGGPPPEGDECPRDKQKKELLAAGWDSEEVERMFKDKDCDTTITQYGRSDGQGNSIKTTYGR